MRSASASAGAIGFSHHTCLPASSAAIAIGACEAFGVVIETTSTAGSAISARQSAVEASKPNSSARRRARPFLDFAQHDPPNDRRVAEHRLNAGPGQRVALAHVARADQSDADRVHDRRLPMPARRPPAAPRQYKYFILLHKLEYLFYSIAAAGTPARRARRRERWATTRRSNRRRASRRSSAA